MRVLKVYDHLFAFVYFQLYFVLLGPHLRTYTIHRASGYCVGHSGVINVLPCKGMKFKIADHQKK